MRENIWISLLIVSLLSFNINADTYLYRVPIISTSKDSVKSDAKNLGMKEGTVNSQPFYGTYILEFSTSAKYYLLKTTLPDGSDPRLDKSMGWDLYQVQRLNESGFIRNVVDNSGLYDNNGEFIVKVSS